MERQISVRLPSALVREIERLAAGRHTGRSAVVREAIQAYVAGPGAAVGPAPYDLVQDLAGSVRGGPPDLGARHREYLIKRFGRG